MESIPDAVAVSEEKGDSFYLDAFMFQAWVGECICHVVQEYSRTNPAERSLQSGQARRAFQHLFGNATENDQAYLYYHLLRLAAFEDSLASRISDALVLLYFEHDLEGAYFNPRIIPPVQLTPEAHRSNPKRLNLLAAETFPRLADWLDAILHLESHEMSHYAPQCFDPDPEKRQLATLGLKSQSLATASDQSKAAYKSHLEALAELKDTPKWKAFEVGARTSAEGVWPFEEADTCIILLWPLLTKHGWSMGQLYNILRVRLSSPSDYPLNSLQDFITHCSTKLGLHSNQLTSPETALTSLPGYHVAQRIISQHLPVTLIPANRK
jgi:hypothetical protein